MSKPWTPRREQLKAVEHLLRHPEAALFGEPGVGKTSIILAALRALFATGIARRALVIAPMRVCGQVWPREVAEWSDFSGLKLHVLHGKGKTDFALNSDAQIFIINPEGLPWLATRTKALGAQVLVIDESSKFKGWMTQRMKLMKKMLPTFERRWIATGSPTPKSLLDLFPQIFCLDMGRAMGPYLSHFRSRWFYNPDGMGWNWIPRPGTEEAIQRMIRPYVLRMENKELPAVVEDVVRVELPEEARRVYDSLEEELIVKLSNGEIVTALSAGTATMKLCQVANGALYAENGKAVALHDAKIDALQELRESLQGASLLVAYGFRHDLDKIAGALFPRKKLAEVPYIGGGVSEKRANDLIDKWNAGELEILLGHPASMGHGLNLQTGGCRHACLYDINWDWELVDQMIRRIRRPGNRHADVFVHYIVATGTVDEAKMRSLRRKKKGQDGLLDALRGYIKEKRG